MSPVSIPRPHLAALRVLCERIGAPLDAPIGAPLSPRPAAWAITGSLGLALQGVEVSVRDIDLRTDAQGARAIARTFADVVARPLAFSESDSIRSHFGAVVLGGATVEIMGDMQQRLPDGTWEDVREWSRHVRRVEVNGLTVPVLSLAYEREMYARLGRADKVALLDRTLAP